MARIAGCADLEDVCRLIKEKENDYRCYTFTLEQYNLLRVFADLSQHFDSIDDFCRLCVAAPAMCLGLDCALYLVDVESGALGLACDSLNGLPDADKPVPVPEYIHKTQNPYEADGYTVLPIQCEKNHNLGTDSPDDKEFLGLFAVAATGLAQIDMFFLSNYADRIGANMHSRLLALQNIRHLKFINGLVVDIEHNVIVPNMYFRHLFNNLKKSVAEIVNIEAEMAALKAKTGPIDNECDAILDRIGHLHQQLYKQHRELQEHHSTTSLFLESLFRRDHFLQGHLVLRQRYCKVEDEIIIPQLEHFAGRFAARGITIEQPVDMGGEELLLVVDVGLLSQVYANFFSNALKYVEEITDHRGNPRKAMSYGREFIANFFGPSRHGVKFNVFSTGHHLSAEEAKKVYNEGFRGEMYKNQPGSGHGLAFVKQIVEIHGGLVGYEATEQGNNFFFVLPLPETESALSVTVGAPQLP